MRSEGEAHTPMLQQPLHAGHATGTTYLSFYVMQEHSAQDGWACRLPSAGGCAARSTPAGDVPVRRRRCGG